MSLFPCDRHGSRIRGSLCAAYVTVLHGTSRNSRKLRLCADCLNSFLDAHKDRWVEVSDNSEVAERVLCGACAEECDKPSSDLPLFVTVYARGAERVDYYGALHAVCAEPYESDLGLRPGS